MSREPLNPSADRDPLRWIMAAAGAYALAGGVITLTGWFANVPRMTDWEGSGISMMPNAAVCAMLAGVALLLQSQGLRKPVMGLGAAVGAIGAATLFEYLTSVSLGIDTLLVYRDWGQRGTVVPGRMGPPGSTSWSLIGVALTLVAGNPKFRGAAVGCSLLALCIAILSIVGYLFDASPLYTLPKFTTIAFQTSTMIFALSIGTIVALPERQPMKTLRAPSTAGMVARRALPLVLLGPVVIGWMRIRGERYLLYDAAFGTALRTLVEIGLFGGFLWWTISKISRYEREQERDSDALQSQASQLAAFLDTAAIALHRVGPDGRILWVNDAELHLLGYSRDQYVGRHIAEFHADQAVIDDILMQLGRGERLCEREARLRCKDGSVKDVLIDSSVLWEGQRFIHTQCFTRDVTERKNSERERERLLEGERTARTQAEQAARTKDEFLAMVSHELRTPLNSILGWAQLLKKNADMETVVEGVDAIERSARAQAQLIDDLLDMNRIISGKLRLDVQTSELEPIIDAALHILRPAADAKGIRIERVVDSAAGQIRGDPTRLQQVIWNLVSNAVKFTPKAGKIQIVLERVNSHAQLSVTDTGIGIDPAFLPHVFERFRQADSSSTRQIGGLGLGLAIAKQIVELHGGSISAKSEGKSRGATFQVRLPISLVKPAGDQQTHTTDAPASKDALAGVRILITDDDPGAREVLLRLLRDSRAVQSAQSGDEALRSISASPPDILLCDIGMPQMDGFEVIRKIRADGFGFPAVAVTAFARAEDRVRALEAGFNMHLSKPIDARELVAVIHSLTRSSPIVA